MKTKRLTKFVSNIKLPDLLFVNFHSNNYENLIDFNNKIKKIFKSEFKLYDNIYNLADLIFMQTRIHFIIESLTLDKGINCLNAGKNYY